VYHDSQPVVPRSNRPRSVLSEKAWLPMIRISLICAVSPSVTVKVRLTRLRSIGVTVVTTSTRQAAAQYWRFELLLGAVGDRLVERKAVTEAHLAQRLQQHVPLELLHADEIDVGDDRALLDDDDDDPAVDVDAHVLEQAGREQRAQRSCALLVVVGVADPKRERREHGARVRALQALDPDVGNRERFDREGRRPDERQGEDQPAQARRAET
jgi:hypothetical protein